MNLVKVGEIPNWAALTGTSPATNTLCPIEIGVARSPVVDSRAIGLVLWTRVCVMMVLMMKPAPGEVASSTV